MDEIAPAAGLAVRCAGLVKRYPKVTALAGIDLEIRRGECFGMLGPNGAGKTTTVEILAGLTRPDGGDVEVLGRRWGAGDDRRLRERLGIQLQETRLPDRLTVAEVLRLFRSFNRRGQAVDRVIAQVGLGEKADARVEKLSGGQRQRLALACALVGDPELLFLDEPTTGLDPQARLKVWELVEEFRAGGATALLTTHYMEEAARLCDRVAILDHGQVIALGTPGELVAALGAEQILQFTAREAAAPLADDALGGLPGVDAVARRNGLFILTVSDVGAALPALLAELGRQGAALDSLTTRQPTLEDVFVDLTGRGLRDE
jgi:ABC-2 type transport system ATP-binding protein